MASSWGFDSSQYYPGFPSAYTRMMLGWDIPQTPKAGLNEVANAELTSINGVPQIYKIGEEFGFPKGEYLLIENRQLYGLDSKLPKAGLAIYHVDEKAGLNNEGFPGQDTWPKNGRHYRVALLQADGFYNLEKGDNKGGSRDFYRGDDINFLKPSKDDPTKGPFPNTDAYQGGNVYQTGVEISGISVSGDVMTFQFSHPSLVTDKPSPRPSPPPSPRPSPRPTGRPTSPPSSLPSARPSRRPSPRPSSPPSSAPSLSPSFSPAPSMSSLPSLLPSQTPSRLPTFTPSFSPTHKPTILWVCKIKREQCSSNADCCKNKCQNGFCKK